MRNLLFVVVVFCASITPTYAHGPLLPPGHGLHGPFPSIHGPLLPPKVAGDPSFVTDCTVLDRDGQIVKGTGVVDFTTEPPQLFALRCKADVGLGARVTFNEENTGRLCFVKDGTGFSLPADDPGELATAMWIETILPSGDAILDCTGDDSTLQWEPNPGL